MNKNTKENKTYLKTGYDELDKMMAIDKNSALITIGGQPSMGKTAFSICLASKLAENKKVLIFSLELPNSEVKLRFLCQYFEFNEIYDKRAIIESLETDILKCMEKKNLYIDDTPNITTDYIENKIKEFKPDVVFIDYLQLIHHPNSSPDSDRKEKIADIMENLKRISTENNVIIFINAQLSRACEIRESKIPILSDFMDNGSTEKFSDVVIFIYRPNYYKLDAEELKKLKLQDTQIIVAKNNFGNCGTINLLFNGKFMKFCNHEQKLLDK